MTLPRLQELKIELCEKEFPFFSDEELNFFLDKYEDMDLCIYYCALRKSENTAVEFSEGMVLPDQSKYFKRIAYSAYDRWRDRNNHSGVK